MSKKKGQAMEMSIEFAEKVFNWANMAFVSSLVVGVVATVLIILTANVKEAGLKRELSAAKVEVGNATVDVAKANERAAEANLKAETERIERLKLEARLAPRNLTLAQQARIREHVKQFAPQPFMFVSYQDDKEVRGLLFMIGRALLDAGWEGRQPNAFLMAELFEGITLELTVDNAEKFRPAAEALSAILNEEGIATSVLVNAKFKEPYDFIYIRLGKKP